MRQATGRSSVQERQVGPLSCCVTATKENSVSPPPNTIYHILLLFLDVGTIKGGRRVTVLVALQCRDTSPASCSHTCTVCSRGWRLKPEMREPTGACGGGGGGIAGWGAERISGLGCQAAFKVFSGRSSGCSQPRPQSQRQPALRDCACGAHQRHAGVTVTDAE